MNTGTRLAIALLVLLGCWYGMATWRQSRLNRWPIRNLPVASGPVVCFGDSLVSGVGASAATETYPAQLGRLLGREVLADGIPGQTTADALARLRDGEGPHDAALVIVTLGGNDMLNRTSLTTTVENLRAIFSELHARRAVVALTVIESPLSGGRGKALAQLCKRQGVIVVPDILGGILNHTELKDDPIHPNDAGYALVAERVDKVLRPYLQQ